MKYAVVTVLALAVVLVMGAMSASSALGFQVLCLKTVEKEWGNFNSGCTVEGAKGNFVRGMILAFGDKVGEGEYCLMVLPGFRTNVKGWTTLEGCRNKEGGSFVETGAVFTRVTDKQEEDKGGAGKGEFAKLPASKALDGFVGEAVLSGGGNNVTCEKGAHAGEITGMKTIGKVVIKFTGCKANGESGSGCVTKSEGGAEGEIVTTTLMGQLGTAKATEASSEVGLLLLPETGSTFTTISGNACFVETRVTGSLAGEVNPVDAEVSDAELAFELSSAKQAIKSIGLSSGAVTPKLVAWSASATEQAIDELEFEGTAEIT